MNAINRAVKKSLVVALLLTFALPLGGVLLGVGLSIGQPAVWAIGIACLAGGFYGCPVAWGMYSGKASLRRLIRAVTEEHLYTERELSMQLGISEKEVHNRINECFSKGYLVGYIRTADGIALNENQALTEKEYAVECPACGAKYSYTKGTSSNCPYCGSPAPRK